MEDVRTKNKIRLIRSNSNLLWFLVIESSCREAWGFFVNLIKVFVILAESNSTKFVNIQLNTDVHCLEEFQDSCKG